MSLFGLFSHLGLAAAPTPHPLKKAKDKEGVVHMHSEDKKEKGGGKEETVLKVFYPPSGCSFLLTTTMVMPTLCSFIKGAGQK